jgi:two-component system cell cycle sensor histidine kinase/response regulator CckA
MSAAVEITSAEDFPTEFRMLFENAPFGLAHCQTDGRVISMNAALERMLGSPAASHLRLADLIRVPDHTAANGLISELSQGHRNSFQIESPTTESRGQTLHWTVWRSTQGNASDDHIYALAQECSPAQIGEQRLQAGRLEAVGRLAGGVAHDFNNLLTGVLLYCDLLVATLEPGNRARKYAEEIRKAGLQATGLVRQLLAIVKPTRSEPRLLSLNDIAESMRNLLVRLIGENIELKFTLDSDLGLIKMDPTQAQQILLNLALNARDAMPGGGRISIETSDCRLQVLADAGDKPSQNLFLPCALLTVEDNGAGMDAHVRAHLFEPFFTTKEGKGTGLGLATVHDIVTGNGGLIYVNSEMGRGTRFSVILPLVPAPLTDSCKTKSFYPSKIGESPLSKEED